MDILYYLDGIAEGRRRRDMVLSSAVSSGVITADQAWPEFFSLPDQGDPDAFPATDADMSEFRLEEATPQSYARDMELLEALAANQRITIREEDPPPFPVLGLPHPEWT